MKLHLSSICRFIALFFLSICHPSLASWSPIPPNFPYPPGPPIGWPLRIGPPPPPPGAPNFFRPPAQLPFPLGDFSGFSPIGFEFPSQEELLQMEREKKQRKERLKAEKSKSIGKRVEDQRYATTTTESNDQRTSTESYSTAGNSFEDKTRFDDSKSIKLTEYEKMKEDRIKSFYRPGDLKDRSESKHEESKKPVDVKRKKTVSPNGQVTFITEMLYDVEGGNPFKPTTSPPPASSPYLPPTTDGMYNPTDDPRLMTQTAHPYTTYLPGTIPRPGESNDDRWHLMPTPPTPFRSSSNKQQQFTERGDLRTSSHHRVTGSHPHQGHHNHHPHSHGHKASTNPRGSSSRRESSSSSNSNSNSIVTDTQGLGAAAIAGIVIGSLVSVALLAGTALFVMYKSPFGRRADMKIGPQGGNEHQHSSQIPVRHPVNRTFTGAGQQQTASSGDVRVCRWPPKRCHNHSPRTSNPNLHN